MRYQSKIIEIPSAYTKAQIETAMDTLTKQGWELVVIQQIATKYYAIFKKLISS